MSSVFGNLSGLVVPSRRWTAIVRNAFGPIAAAADVLAIVAAAGITGVAYHALVYGSFGETVHALTMGAAAAGLFAILNVVRGEYTLTHYFVFRNHIRRFGYNSLSPAYQPAKIIFSGQLVNPIQHQYNDSQADDPGQHGAVKNIR